MLFISLEIEAMMSILKLSLYLHRLATINLWDDLCKQIVDGYQTSILFNLR